MQNFFGKLILSFLILAGACVFALDSEYKNTLNKIEVVKTGEDNYSVNLYTQKGYSQQPKIIKKSDYNYYILLPETKNSAPAASKNSQDIRSVSANLYPYAGQDINNGYTKINISTTKPVNFSLSVRNSGTKAASATPAKATTVKPQEKKTALAPSNSSNVNKTTQNTAKNIHVNPPTAKLQPKQNIAKTTPAAPVNANKQAAPNKQIAQNTQAKKVQTQIQNTQKTAVQPQKKQSNNLAQNTTNKVQNASQTAQTKTTKPQAKPDTAPVSTKTVKPAKPVKTKTKPIEDIPKPVILPDENSIKTPVVEPQETQATYSQGEIFIPRANNASIEDDDMFKDDYSEFGQNAIFNWFKKNFNMNYLENLRNNAEYRLIQYGLDFADVAWMIFAAIVSLMVLIKICTKKHPQTAKLKSKADFMERKYKKAPVKNPAKKKRPPHFASNKDIRQKKSSNFELSGYRQPEVKLEKVEPQYNGTAFNNIPDEVTKPQYNLYQANNIEDIVEKAHQIERGENDIQIQRKIEAEADKQVIQNFGLNEEALELYNVNEPVDIEEITIDTPSIQNNEFKNEDIVQIQNEPAQQHQEYIEPQIQPQPQRQGLQQRLNEAEQMQSQAIQPTVAQPKPHKEIGSGIPGLKVLSSVEIAPERGFMCVSYNNNVSLVGYIFDDVFALHNFKVAKLHDYNIKFRLSERDAKGAYFIVKVDDSKLLIKVTKMAMALEVAM